MFTQCDASDSGAEAVLYQDCGGAEHPISYASKSLTKAHRPYSVTEKELFGVLFGIEKFRSYAEGTDVTVETDHLSLLWLTNLSNPLGRQNRWAVALSQYRFTIKHCEGSLNVVTNALSRSVADVSVLAMPNFKPDKWY